jgi:KDO2-lipid IV(A) lauroyltransferase
MIYLFLKIWLYFFKFICRYWPAGIRLFSWKIYFIIAKVIRYRKKVILDNFKACFGSAADATKIREWQQEYYHVLRRYVLESMYVAAMPADRLLNLVGIQDKEAWQSYFDQYPKTVIMASHYGNWEMNMVLLPALINRRVIAFYKPISDASVAKFMHTVRSAYGLELYPIEQTLRIMKQFKDENALYIFIGDQSPVNLNGVYWNQFLGRKTPWLTGAEKLATRFGYPMVYLHQEPQHEDSLCYTLRFELMTEHPKNEEEGQMTEYYSQLLEAEITKNPVYWLWSHKRWKRVKDA